jgi:hypothetical protein
MALVCERLEQTTSILGMSLHFIYSLVNASHSILPNTVQRGAVAACFVSPQEDGVKSDRASTDIK